MIKQWIKNISEALDEASSDKQDDAALQRDTERVSAQILLEVARADFGIEEEELATVIDAIKQTSSLDAEEIAGIVAAAKQEVEQALSYHQHVKAINDSFEHPRKLQLVEQMWRVAFADDQLDRYEEAFIRRFCDLIYVSHKEFMQAKLKVKGEWG